MENELSIFLEKQPYHSPTLTLYGEVSQITEAGYTSIDEPNVDFGPEDSDSPEYYWRS